MEMSYKVPPLYPKFIQQCGNYGRKVFTSLRPVRLRSRFPCNSYQFDNVCKELIYGETAQRLIPDRIRAGRRGLHTRRYFHSVHNAQAGPSGRAVQSLGLSTISLTGCGTSAALATGPNDEQDGVGLRPLTC